jgi:hypothetical protein
MGKFSSSLVLSTALFVALATMTACMPPESNESIESSEQTESQNQIVTLYVGPEQVDCVGVAPQQCLLVRESLEEDYSYFYSTIEGFNYEPGYAYELLVEKAPVEDPPADGSSIRWTLVEVVAKVPASGSEAE